MSRLRNAAAAVFLLGSSSAFAALPENTTLDAFETTTNFSWIQPPAPATPNQGAICTVNNADIPYTKEDLAKIDGFFAVYDQWLKQYNYYSADAAIEYFGGRERDETEEMVYSHLLAIEAVRGEYNPGTPGSVEILQNDAPFIISAYIDHAASLKYMLDENADHSEQSALPMEKLRALLLQDNYAKGFAESMMALTEDRAAYVEAACSRPASIGQPSPTP